MGKCLQSDSSCINDLEEQLCVLFNEVNSMIKSGNKNDAVDLLKANYEAVKEQIDAGFRGREEARVLDTIALGHVALGDLTTAISIMDLLNGIVEHLKNDEPLLDSILMHMGSVNNEGRALLEECLLITEKSKGKDHPNCVKHLLNLATSYSRSKNYAEAEKLLRISLQIMLKTLPHDDQSISFPMLNLALTLFNLNQVDEAEKYALEVLRIRENAFGKESLPVGEVLDCLVSIQKRLGRDDNELLEHLKRILKIQEKAFGSESEEVMETLKKVVHYMTTIGLRHEKLPLERRLARLKDKYKHAVKQY
ncbi:unnamed protein product [Cuscuta campestris]|uniref:MalT-like TPR region domain-containing protein n=1 Tax=Cuscuta campestris TaxID=132261 RepID=A0A484L8S9_9ASTE|nr:unnamed protein product [Cuscuta campestris]